MGAAPGPCVWCGSSDGSTADHVFPKFLGGTLSMCVPACAGCQSSLSGTEMEVARRTEVALHRLRTPTARSRHPDRGSSGALQVNSAVMKHPDGSLRQTALQIGKDPRILPALEADFVTNKLEWTGTEEELGELRGELYAKRKQLRSVPVDLVMDENVSRDPGFRPRIYLARSGKLRILARSAAEAKKLMIWVRGNADNIRRNRPKNLRTTALSGAHEVFVQMYYSERSLARVVAKIALGTLLVDRPELATWDGFSAVRRFVREGDPDFCDYGTLVDFDQDGHESWPVDHVAVVQVAQGTVVALVVVYSAAFFVFLGPPPPGWTSQQVAARCSYLDGQTRLLTGDAAEAATREVIECIEAARGESIR